MDDKTIMEDILLTTKGVCDLYMHGAIESGTANVRNAFNTALDDTLKMQDAVFQQMTRKGFYTQTQAEPQQINQVKQKFAQSQG